MTYLTPTQTDLLAAAIGRVEQLHPTLRGEAVEHWLERVIYLCRLEDPAFGRKRNPSGVLSRNVLGVQVAGQQPPYFEAVDVVRDAPDAGNPLRTPWAHYPPGPTSDADHVGPDQAWVAQTAAYADTQWVGQPPAPADPPADPLDPPDVKRSEFLALTNRVARLEASLPAPAPAPTPGPAPDPQTVGERLDRIIADLQQVRAQFL